MLIGNLYCVIIGNAGASIAEEEQQSRLFNEKGCQELPGEYRISREEWPDPAHVRSRVEWWKLKETF